MLLRSRKKKKRSKELKGVELMQTPDGKLKPLPVSKLAKLAEGKRVADSIGRTRHAAMAELFEKELEETRKKAHELEKETGKKHPIFVVGEELTIKGGLFKVHKILKNRMMLKPIKY